MYQHHISDYSSDVITPLIVWSSGKLLGGSALLVRPVVRDRMCHVAWAVSCFLVTVQFHPAGQVAYKRCAIAVVEFVLKYGYCCTFNVFRSVAVHKQRDFRKVARNCIGRFYNMATRAKSFQYHFVRRHCTFRRNGARSAAVN